ncbi:MAG: hypothetical protein RLZZ116_1302 [Planctomycetota bacterium]|jgi:predicted outer membrane repeat protein
MKLVESVQSRARLGVTCTLALLAAPPAQATLVGCFVTATPTSSSGEQLVRYEVVARFNGATDTLLNLFNLSVSSGVPGFDPHGAFWHKDNSSYNGGILSKEHGTWAPQITGSATLNRPYDSFLTIGGTATATNTTGADPSWNSGGSGAHAGGSASWNRADLPNNGTLGWFNSVPPNLQGRVGIAPNTVTDVMLGQFVLSTGHPAITMTLSCGYNDGVAGSTVGFCNFMFTLQSIWYYRDADGDGFGSPTGTILAVPTAGFVANNLDCNDSNPAIHPDTVWYRDLDGDGFGSAANGTITRCTPPTGYVLNNSDNCPSIANPSQADCDADARGDACELASGESSDWNGNGVPDACAGEFVVGASGGFMTIQSAVNAAPNRTTITIAPGTYGSVDLGARSVTLRGVGPFGSVVIDAQHADSCIRMFNVGGEQPLIERLVLRNGAAENGAGISIVLSSPTIRDCVIEQCSASSYGGAVLLNGSAALLERCVLRDCTATIGGGVAVIGAPMSGVARMTDCTIERNAATTQGGAIYTKSPFLMTGSAVLSNISPLGGGIRFDPVGNAQLGSTRFCLNVVAATAGPFLDLGGNGFDADCNSNGLCDSEEIAASPALDIDHDGSLDSCERARGDLDLDGVVAGGDLTILLAAWGQSSNSIADIDGDGLVNGSDLTRLLAGWGI